jgi:chemotaxis protein methyltransferase CheR
VLAQLIDEVAVQETYFMREPQELEQIDWRRLLACARARGEPTVRVWVAACASGEEAYSVAMLAAESFDSDSPPVSILATDISERALRRAREGIYSERSTREVGPERRERFFLAHDRRAAVGEQLRAPVTFRRHNLIADASPPEGESPFDVILCRNVLIYFGPANVERVVKALESSLRPGGQLILGASDRLTSSASRFPDLAARAVHGARASSSKAGRRSSSASQAAPRPAASRRSRTATSAVSAPSAPPPRSPRATADALAAANAGNLPEAIAITAEILAGDPLDAEAYFVRGLTELAAGDAESAGESLRRALYIEPTFALAAFQLGRTHDLRGDSRAARRAYRQALGALDAGADEHQPLLELVHAGDIAAACRARLGKPGERSGAPDALMR